MKMISREEKNSQHPFGKKKKFFGNKIIFIGGVKKIRRTASFFGLSEKTNKINFW